MWSSVLAFAFFAALDPVRLGIILLVISRPRPVQNLLAYWAGGLIAGIPSVLVPLVVLHATPMAAFTANLATSSTFRHIQVGMGVLALSIAAVLALRSSTRQRVPVSSPGGDSSTLVMDSQTPTAVRWLIGRAHNAWENGSLWISLVLGLGSGPPLDGLPFVLAIIMASGAAIGTQVAAGITFVIGVFAIVELILVCYLITPTKTQAVLRLVHDWVRAHRRQILIAVFAVVGVLMVVGGLRSA